MALVSKVALFLLGAKILILLIKFIANIVHNCILLTLCLNNVQVSRRSKFIKNVHSTCGGSVNDFDSFVNIREWCDFSRVNVY